MKTQAELNRIAQEQEEAKREAMLKKQESGEPAHQIPVVQEKIYTEAEADDEDVLHAIIVLYKKNFSEESWYEEPKINKNGRLSLSFKDEETATAFAEELAQAGHIFVLIDGKTGEARGYSDGSSFYKNTDNKSVEEIKSELGGQSNRPGM